ncbi:MAG: serine hydrolase domain-containing protein [Verrucomicrobiales bacterium]
MGEPATIAARVAEQFEANLPAELGAAVAVYLDGEEVVSLAGGFTTREREHPWTTTTLAPVYSATKGPAAACVLLALHDHGLEPDTAVARVWPKLPPHLTIAELLSHQGGLAALDRAADVFDHEDVVTALEEQTAAWGPPEHGYHPRTFGCLADELVRRLTGAPSLGNYWREAIAGPHGIDFWIGLPESEHHRVATLIPGRPDIAPDEAEFYRAFNDTRSEVRRAFLSPRGLHSVAEMNQPRAWMAGLPGFGGIGSAAGLARFYGLLACGKILPAPALAWARRRLVNGPDRILRLPTAFSCGFMLDPLDGSGNKIRCHFGSGHDAFGHPGAGGSHAFADPARRLGFAYVMNQMALAVLPHDRALKLVAALE